MVKCIIHRGCICYIIRGGFLQELLLPKFRQRLHVDVPASSAGERGRDRRAKLSAPHQEHLEEGEREGGGGEEATGNR